MLPQLLHNGSTRNGRASYRCRASAKGGQLAQKNLRGAMRPRRRRQDRLDPLPPLPPVLARQNAFLQSKTPLYMICVVNCYGQRAAYQRLARAGQTVGVGSAGTVLGGVACGVPMGRTAGARAGHAHVRGDCIQSKGRNAFNTLLRH